MSKKLLIYRLNEIDHHQSIKMICRMKNIEIYEIDDCMIHLKLKNILDQKIRKRKSKSLALPMIVFSGMLHDEIEDLLQSFKDAGIPFIPLKAVVTATNLQWPFERLYRHIFEEYQQVVQKNLKL